METSASGINWECCRQTEVADVFCGPFLALGKAELALCARNSNWGL
jgi:hypothetical protein